MRAIFLAAQQYKLHEPFPRCCTQQRSNNDQLNEKGQCDLPIKPIDLPKTNNPLSAPISTNSSASSLK